MPVPGDRARYLDLLRGIAILGILPANIGYHGLPMTWGTEPAPLTGGLAEHLVYSGTETLVEYKFITLFALLFGAGLAIQRGRAEEAGRPWRAMLVRRLVVLGVVGCAHAVLLWYGDVLAAYAAIGLAWIWAAGWAPRTLERVGIGLLAVPAAVMLLAVPVLALAQGLAALAPLFAETTPAGVSAGAASADWGTFFRRMWEFDPGFEIELRREAPWIREVLWRACLWPVGWVMVLCYFGWRIAGLVCLGMAFARRGWLLDPAAHPDAFRRLRRWGFATGIPLTVLAVLLGAGGCGGVAAAAAAEAAHYVGSLGLAAGYAGVVGALAARGDAWWRGPLEACGRTAFSNYLGQTLVTWWLFSGHGVGLGWFGALDRVQLLGVVAAIWAASLVASTLWLRAFALGPAEWAWRVCTYARWVPLRRAP